MSVDYVQSFKTKEMKTITQKLSSLILLMRILNLPENVEAWASDYKSAYMSVSLNL